MILIVVSGGMVQDVMASDSQLVYIIDEDNQKVGEPSLRTTNASKRSVGTMRDMAMSAERKDKELDPS